MNDNILRAIESLCDDIATDTNAEDNQKRANAILTLAFGGIFTPEEIEEDYTEDDSAAGAEKDKIKFPKPGEQFEYNGIKFTALGEEQGGVLAIVSELLEDEMPLDESNKNDWRTSSLRKHLNGEYLEQFNRGDLPPPVCIGLDLRRRYERLRHRRGLCFPPLVRPLPQIQRVRAAL